MATLHRISVEDAKLNTFFSAPVFFDDGKCMFLAQGKAVKPYHIAALKRWKIPFLMTAGHALEQSEGQNIEQMAGFDKMRGAGAAASAVTADDLSFENIASIEEI